MDTESLIGIIRGNWLLIAVDAAMAAYFIYQMVGNYTRLGEMKKKREQIEKQTKELKKDTELKLAEMRKIIVEKKIAPKSEGKR